MDKITSSPLFGIVLSLFFYEIGLFIQNKIKSPLANPMVIAVVGIVGVLLIFRIPLTHYQNGGNVVSLFLAPTTAILAVNIYGNLKIIKENLLPILAGCFVGSLVSVTSVFVMGKLLHLDDVITYSLLPKSVTTPIAVELSNQLGGIIPITITAITITGMIGAVFAPILINLFKIRGDVAKGLAIGTASHALGTSKAVELGEEIGALSGVAIGISGMMTVLITMIFMLFFLG